MQIKTNNMDFNRLNNLLPITIDRWSYDDPILHFGGGENYVNVITLWRIIFDGSILASSENCPDEISLKIVGDRIVKVESLGKHIVEPVFHFENGLILEVFTVDMGVESWLINFRGKELLESFGS